jgi:hypothetical protein
MSATAVLLAVIALAFLLLTGDVLAAFGFEPMPAADFSDAAAVPAETMTWLRGAAFARLFAATLMGVGFILWHMGPLVVRGAERKIGLIIAAALGLTGLMSLIQQIAIFGTPAGWTLAAVLLGLAALFTVAALRRDPPAIPGGT